MRLWGVVAGGRDSREHTTLLWEGRLGLKGRGSNSDLCP